jgi:outer membrane autotransporter protein
VSTPSGTAILTNYAGSRIAGPINMFGGPTALLNFVGGNYLYTLNSLTGVTINTNDAPFAVRGNSVAVLDPTALALEDRSVMNFTAGVSSMLQDRFHAMPVSGGAAGGGAMSFASDTTSRIDDAHNAFSGMPSISMAYGSTDTGKLNANAMSSKAPALAVPAYDTVVWASGFGGERQQREDGPIQRARDDAYGGAIGIDRQITPDLRLGAFAGGGNSQLSVAYDIQRVASDYVFGGGYGRWDKHDYYVDFALFGGGISSSSSRQIANNTVPSGLEIATASYNGWFFSPDVTYGYRIFSGDNVFTPKARVRYVGGTLDGYTEAGSAQGLIMGKRNLSDVEERLGVEFASIKPATFGGTLKTTVEVSGLGLQRLGDSAINAVLLAQNVAFTTPGRSEAFGGVVSLGLDWRPRSNVSVYASVEGTAMSDKSFSATGKGGIRIGF